MRNFINIFRFEFLEMVRKRSVQITTLIMALAILVVTSLPTIIGMFDSGDESPSETVEYQFGFVLKDDGIPADELAAALGLAELDVYANETALRAAVTEGEIAKGFIMQSLTDYTMLTMDQTMTDSDQYIFESVLRSIAVNENYRELGIDPSLVLQAQAVELNVNTEVIGRSSSQGFMFAYIMMFVLYMLILFFGQSVATSVAREKDSRTMELLITSTKPNLLILGKVAAMAAVGLIQVSILIAVALIGFLANQANYPEFLIEMLKQSAELPVILVYIAFSVSGYALYLFIYASLGSLVSKVEDVSSAVTPVTLLFVAAFFIASIALNLPNSQIVVISSYVPFSSLFTMPIRYMLTTIHATEVLLSLALMFISTALIAWFSIYVYRYGSLNYGNKLKLGEMIKQLIKRQT